MNAPTLFDDVPSGEHHFVGIESGISAGGWRRTDPETSKEAAAKIGKGVEQAVLVEHQRARAVGLPGLTDDELAARLHWMHGPTVKSARSRLVKKGQLEDAGSRRESSRGMQMIVWRACA